MHAHHTDIVVIGAGFAGLSAAHALERAGFSVAVVEAQARVGGRAQTVHTTDGVPIELGAVWVGPEMQRVRALAQRFGIPLIPTPHHGRRIYDLLGRRLTGRGEVPPFPPHVLADLTLFMARLDRLRRRVHTPSPWTTEWARHWDLQNCAAFIARHVRTRLGRAYANAFFVETLAAEFHEVSVLDVLWGIATMGSMQALQATEQDMLIGTQPLAEALARALTGPIFLNSPVHRVAYDAQQVCVHSDELKITARRAVVAMPPVLAGRLTYDPPLPALRDGLTQRSGPGAVIKIVAVYPTPFWREAGWSGEVISDRGPLRAVMDCSSPGGPGQLVGFVSATHARQWDSTPPARRQAEVLEQLTAYFGARAALPEVWYEKDWTADPWARGGYGTHFAPGVLSVYGPALHAPVGPLYWAGTEVATEWRLYLEGAVQSGEAAAEAIVTDLRTSLA